MTIPQFVVLALQEDVKNGDHSALSCIPAAAQSRAKLLVKDAGILAGVAVAQQVFEAIDPTLSVQIHLTDGKKVQHGDIALHVEGSVHSILIAERLVLNVMQRMSGIATITRKMVDALHGLPTQILDTRKTTPLLRFLEKQAVVIGGGTNHRFGLYDMIMLKDNHIDYAGGIAPAIKSAQNYLTTNKLDLKIEVETRNLHEVQQVLDCGGIHRIMLDNFDINTLTQAVKMIDKRYETEASGGITIDTIKNYAQTGVQYISVGALTHSVKSLDLSLKAC
jgi:nicotinate-nucleotide pyrophosphorylase (carboxylating)